MMFGYSRLSRKQEVGLAREEDFEKFKTDEDGFSGKEFEDAGEGGF
jgi:hypothetical protein